MLCEEPALNCLRRFTISYSRCSSKPLLLHHFLDPPPLSPFTCFQNQFCVQWRQFYDLTAPVLILIILNIQHNMMLILLTSTQALKVLRRVKGSPWLLCRGCRAVAQSGLCCELRRKGDWTLRAAATVSTGSTKLNKQPSTSIFPKQTQTCLTWIQLMDDHKTTTVSLSIRVKLCIITIYERKALNYVYYVF